MTDHAVTTPLTIEQTDSHRGTAWLVGGAIAASLLWVVVAYARSRMLLVYEDFDAELPALPRMVLSVPTIALVGILPIGLLIVAIAHIPLAPIRRTVIPLQIIFLAFAALAAGLFFAIAAFPMLKLAAELT